MKLTDKVKLIIAKVEILKLRAVNGGYEWSMLSDKERTELESTLKAIDELIEKGGNSSQG